MAEQEMAATQRRPIMDSTQANMGTTGEKLKLIVTLGCNGDVMDSTQANMGTTGEKLKPSGVIWR
jgi:hypothetical protein